MTWCKDMDNSFQILWELIKQLQIYESWVNAGPSQKSKKDHHYFNMHRKFLILEIVFLNSIYKYLSYVKSHPFRIIRSFLTLVTVRLSRRGCNAHPFKSFCYFWLPSFSSGSRNWKDSILHVGHNSTRAADAVLSYILACFNWYMCRV